MVDRVAHFCLATGHQRPLNGSCSICLLHRNSVTFSEHIHVCSTRRKSCVIKSSITITTRKYPFRGELFLGQSAKSKNWLVRNRNNVSDLTDISSSPSWASTITNNPTKCIGLVQSGHLYHLVECENNLKVPNLFYDIADKLLIQIHPLIMWQFRGIINEKWTCSKSKNSHRQYKEGKQSVCERTFEIEIWCEQIQTYSIDSLPFFTLCC